MVQTNAHSEPDTPFQHKKKLSPNATDGDLPKNLVEQQQAAFKYYKIQTIQNEGMKELIQKELKNREETIARQKESTLWKCKH